MCISIYRRSIPPSQSLDVINDVETEDIYIEVCSFWISLQLNVSYYNSASPGHGRGEGSDGHQHLHEAAEARAGAGTGEEEVAGPHRQDGGACQEQGGSDPIQSILFI